MSRGMIITIITIIIKIIIYPYDDHNYQNHHHHHIYNIDNQGDGTIGSFKLLDDNVPHLSLCPYNARGEYDDYNDDNDNYCDYDDNQDDDGTQISSIIVTSG